MGWIICGGIVTAYFIGLTCLFADLASAPIMDTEKDTENGSPLHGSTDDDTEGVRDDQFSFNDLRRVADMDQHEEAVVLIGGRFDGKEIRVRTSQRDARVYDFVRGVAVLHRYTRTNEHSDGRPKFKFDGPPIRNNSELVQQN